jgi:anti-anti-sigma factor
MATIAAFMPEPHILLSVVQGASSGSPAPSRPAAPAPGPGRRAARSPSGPRRPGRPRRRHWRARRGSPSAKFGRRRRGKLALKAAHRRARGALEKPGASGGDLVLLDLSEVEFLDSSGLGAVVAARKLLGKQYRLALAGLQPAVEKVLRLTHMDRVFPIYATSDAFLADVGGGERT